MKERAANAGKILNANEHLVVSASGGHQQRFRLTFASFKSEASVTALPCQVEGFDISERFVDHDRSQACDAMNGHLATNSQIARRGLFHVLQAIEGSEAESFDTFKQIDDVIFVRALLIEIERQFPLSLRSHHFADPRYFDNTSDVPIDVVAGQFEFQVTKAVCLKPFFERLWVTVVQSSTNIHTAKRV